MEQFPYSSYTIGFDYWNEPRSLMLSYHNMGAMPSWEAYARVVTGLPFLIREFELKEKYRSSR